MKIYSDNYRYNNSYKVVFKAGLTELEKALMEEVVDYTGKKGVETLRIIKDGVNITDRFTIIEEPKRCEPVLKEGKRLFGIYLGKFAQRINSRRYFKNSVQIHSHQKELPLGPADIRAALKVKMAKSIAVTPSGKYSSVTIKPEQRKFVEQYLYLFDEWSKNISTVKKDDEKGFLKIVQSSLASTWETFARKTGVEYESNI